MWTNIPNKHMIINVWVRGGRGEWLCIGYWTNPNDGILRKRWWGK